MTLVKAACGFWLELVDTNTITKRDFKIVEMREEGFKKGTGFIHELDCQK